MAEVVLNVLSKVFDKKVVAVDNISLKMADKEFVVLVGPSGCGKSTTLRMIAGLEEITKGEIFIDDRLVNDVPPKDRDIAMVFQNYALYPHMTVFDNMAFGLKLRKFPKKEIEQRVKDAAVILGIEDLLNRKPKALSGGQRQRVAVGRAIVRKPKVFLFDEPLSNLDAKLRVQMRTEISKLHSKLETTMIYVTHDQVEAMTMGDKIVVMKDGKICQTDSPLNLYDKPSNLFVASFIGSPSMNFFDGKIVKNNGLNFSVLDKILFQIPEKYYNSLNKYIDKPIIMGVRPEHIMEVDKETENSFSCDVEVVEPMGNETFLYLKLGEKSFVSRFNTDKIYRYGQKSLLRFDLERSHFFDPVSEISIFEKS
ncbi:ABC transporter ATP-binding protein [candidate division KSB1 bacterium]